MTEDDDDRVKDKEPLWSKGLRSAMGAPRKFNTPEELSDAVCGYFQWIEDNPLKESKLVSFQGDSKLEQIPKMQAATQAGLCLYLGIHEQSWREWRENRADLSEVIKNTDMAIRNQKFVGAAADLLNANIISRDLGLADRNEHTGGNGAPLVKEMDHVELARHMAFILRRGVETKAEEPE